MTGERVSERHERRLPQLWARRALLAAAVVVTGWLFLGGSPAEAASAAPSDRTAADVAAADAVGPEGPSSVGIVKPTAVRVTEETRQPDRVHRRSHTLDKVPTNRTGTVDRVIGDTVQAVEGSAETPVETPVETSAEQSGQAIEVVRTGVIPALDALAGTTAPVVEPVDEVTPATPGEPGIPSGTDRESPGSSVEAPLTSTESVIAMADSARPSSGSSPTPPPGGRTSPGSGAGADGGPAQQHPVRPVPGPSQDVPDGATSTASGHGSVDRGQTASSDISPLVLGPRLITSRPANSRPTGYREPAIRPSVSPD